MPAEHQTSRSFAATAAVSEVQPLIILQGQTHSDQTRPDHTRRYPLSPLQSGMLFHHLADPQSGVDLEQLLCQCPEPLDASNLERALDRLLEWHPILRTRFHWKGGGENASQEIVPAATVPVAREKKPQDFQTFLARDRRRGIDMEVAPMMRATVFEEEGCLLLTFHHALLDGRSLPVLLEDLFRFYEGRKPSEPRQRMPYKNYIHWLEQQDFTRSENFWRSHLRDFQAPTPLVVDDLGASEDDLQWQEEIVVDLATTQQLGELARSAEVTMNTIVQAAWALLLGKYSGETDVVFGGTRACRKSAGQGAENSLGLFINTLPVRARVAPEKPLGELLTELRADWVAMRPHEHTPLAQVQAWSQIPPGESLFQSLLVFEQFDLDLRMKRLGNGWTNRSVTLYEKTNYPITVAAYLDAGLRIKIEYAPEKFTRPVITRMLEHLRHLLVQMAAGIDRPIGSFSLAAPDEVKAIQTQWANPTPATAPTRTLISWFEDQAAATPGAVALSFENETLTFAELNARANQLGHRLRQEYEVGPETIVGICVERSLDTVIGILGILKAGGAYLPIDSGYPGDRLNWMLEDSRAPVLLTQRALLAQMPETPCQVVALDDLPPGPASWEENLEHRITPDSLAYVIFTSGSTGKPKGVEITHGNVVRLMEQTDAWFGFNEHDVWTLFHSFAFDFSVWEIWGALLYGGRLVVVPYDVTRSPESFHRLLAEQGVTVLNQTPSAFRQLIHADAQANASLSLRYVIFGGEALEMASLQPWFDRHGDGTPQLVNMYGITETTVHVTYRAIRQDDLGSGSVIGQPIPDLEIHLLDPQGHPVPLGVPGEIYVGGGGLARGYLERAQLTAERFPPHPYKSGHRLYRTGDVARFLPDNDLEYLGRCDEQVKIRGFRIELGEIQTVMCQHAAVREGFVCLREDEPGNPKIVAYLVLHEQNVTLTDLRQHAEHKLPSYMVPAAFVFLEEFPLTNNGKINRKALPAPALERETLGSTYCAPSNDSERVLAEIWSRVLNAGQVGVHDNYFELGGDSILSIQIVSQARAEGLSLTPRDLFEHRTVAELARAASRDIPQATAYAPSTEPAPLTPIQHWFSQLALPNPHHWNQAFLFALKRPVEPKRLRNAFAQVAEHHQAFQLRFLDECQEVHEPRFSFTVSDEPYALEHCQEAQKTLDITKGPLLHAVLFPDNRLFIAVHHLIMDGVSWRILLEDLEAACTGKPLPQKTAPFTDWAHRQETLAESPSVLKQLTYWHKAEREFTLPHQTSGNNTVADAENILVSLTVDESRQLLDSAPRTLRTQINELLLASLAQALGEWTGQPEISLDMEGHGREASIGLDLSRTIGWFTTIFPVSLTAGDTLTETLRHCKETLRAIPDRGLGYGLLGRWGHLEDTGRRQVLFNFLGQLDQLVAGSQHFAFAPEPSGCWYDAMSKRPYLLEINSWVKEGKLEFQWTFPKSMLESSVIQEVAEKTLTCLRSLLQSARQANPACWTLSDFPLAPFNNTQALAALGQQQPRSIEDITGLGPLQQLYFTLETARPGSGIDQWHWQFNGPVDRRRLEKAWQTVVNRHSTLRSSYHGEHAIEPLAIIRRHVTLSIHEEDWRDLPIEEQRSKFQHFLQRDAEQGLPIDQAPLMRLSLIRVAKDRSFLVWTHHHLQIDGWSWPVILSEVSKAYAGGGSLPARAPAFAGYLAWLQRQDNEAARRFWKVELAGLTKPVPMPGHSAASGRMAEVTLRMPADMANSLKERARDEGVTLNAILQTALGMLLARQARADEALFGASFSGRPADLPDVESIVGAFVNNVPIRVCFKESDSVSDVIQRTHAKLGLLGEHQFLSLIEIQRCSEIPLRRRLFEILLVFQNYRVDPEALRWGDKVGIEEFTAPVRTNYPFTITVNADSEVELCAIYQEARFGKDYVQDFLGHYLDLLGSLAASSETKAVSLLQKIDIPPVIAEDVAPRSNRAIVPPRTGLERSIAAVWQTAFGHDQISVDDQFFDLGGHSLLLVQVHRLLKKSLRRDLSLVDVFRHPTIATLAASLEGPKTLAALGPESSRKTKDIAIIGMSGRFPGAESVDAFWKNLVNGLESIATIGDEKLRAEGLDPAVLEAEGHYVRSRGLIEDPGGFDAAFFDITPKEAEATDPQQRLFLELAWSALEDAGYTPSRFSDRIGVFAGMSNNTYFAQYVQPDSGLRQALGDLTVMMGNEKDYLATRTAYKLNLRGPALSIYTACSTALVALAEAVYALREGRCEMAISGAVSLTFPFQRGYCYKEGGITSADGHCRPFDEQAGGTVFSNGMGAVILKPLDEALAQGDTVHAVIKGVGLNNDGSNKVSFTAPSVEGQAGAILQAQADAGFSPETIGYVEAHGTGTALGDPIEVEALTLAFRQATQNTGFCRLGSVKSNIGHLDAAAGMAGLIKATLALKHGIIPATLHGQRPNPALRLAESPFQLAATTQPWTAINGSPRRAGVSSFGVGGTNAHIVLEQAPPEAPTTPCPRGQHLLLLSAKTPEALAAMRFRLAEHLQSHPDIDLADVAYTLQTGREQFAHRCSLVVGDREDAIAALRSDEAPVVHEAQASLPVAFLFPGQGAQFAGMGSTLYESESLYREIVDHAAEVLQPLLGQDIREILFQNDEARLKETRFTQPALLVTSYAMAKLWQRWGVQPDRMIGHSVGEYTAACLAGVLTFDDALRLVAKRAGLVRAQPAGAMLAVRLPEDDVLPLLREGIEIAALNSPRMTVVAGRLGAIEAFAALLQERGIACKELRTSHAFHSEMMEPVVAPFEEILAQTPLDSPQIDYVSNVSGRWARPDETTSPRYWSSHVRQPVRFAEGLQRLTESSSCVFLEVGPGQSLASFARHAYGRSQGVVASLPNVETTTLWHALGRLWSAGGRIDWQSFYQGERRRRVPLPAYPFQHTLYWPKSVPHREAEAPVPAVPEIPPDVDRRTALLTALQEEMQSLTGLTISDLDPKTGFLELGFDSLLLGQASTVLRKRFAVRVSFRRLMEDLDNLSALSRFLDRELPADQFAPKPAAPGPEQFAGKTSGSLEDRMQVVERTLERLQSGGLERSFPQAEHAETAYNAGKLHQAAAKTMVYGPFRPPAIAGDGSLTPTQSVHLSGLIERYTSFTAGSRAHTQKHRRQLADPRSAAGFNPLWKAMVYPIVTKRSEGARLWDIDDNEWIDVTLGFGLGLFGHRPDFVVDAVEKQMSQGFEIGPSTLLAGEVAAMLCEISGKDRVTFCNTGSEAVMAAIRLARAASQRSLIAAFAGSYHGIFDEVLGRPLVANGELRTVPIAPGIPNEHVSQILLLEYGNPESLTFIERYGDELAAVLVEPVQSRRPDLQPRAFLKSLREMATRHEIALVFDEIVTGFRCHPRGAQGLFGIDADLVTYGKVLGGGIPIGALAGRQHYMDALDGGHWQYDDESAPEASVTFFAGTFVRHPLALAAARAVLTKIQETDASLQEGLDAKTAAMVDAMNAFCERVNVPIRVTRFSSMFFFNFAPELRHASLFFYHLRLRGIHAWETRPSFLSLAHTDADIDYILTAFRDSIRELQQADFLPKPLGRDFCNDSTSFPLTEAQQEMFLVSQLDENACRACNEALGIELKGPVDVVQLKAAIECLIDHHESLRTVFAEDGTRQTVLRRAELPPSIQIIDLSGMPQTLAEHQRQAQETLINLTQGPLVQFHIFVLAPDKHVLLMVGHHIILDGWSYDILYHQLGQAYSGSTDLEATPFRIYAAEHLEERSPDTEAYWLGQFSDLPEPLQLPADHGAEFGSSYRAGSVTMRSPEGLAAKLQACCKRYGVTPYVLMLAAYRELLGRLTGQDDLVIGAPMAGQAAAGLEGLCGHCVQFLPMRFRRQDAATVHDLVQSTRRQTLDAMEHQQYTLGELTKKISHDRAHDHRGLVAATFTLEPLGKPYAFEGIEASLCLHPKRYLTFDFSIFVIAEPDAYTVIGNFSAEKFTGETVERWLGHYFTLLECLCEADPEQPVYALPMLSQEERHTLLVAWNADALACPTPKESVVALFEEQASSRPDAIALTSHAGQLTYAELNQCANSLAARLQKSGVQRGDRVALFAERSPALIVATLATLKAGAAFVPMAPEYPEERLAWMLKDTAPSAILTEPSLRERLDSLSRNEAAVLEIDKAARTNGGADNPNMPLGPEDLACILYTSGSTGQPKGVCVPHRGITRLVTAPNYMAMTSSDVFLQASNFSFDASLLEVWAPLLNGATLALPPAGPVTVEVIAEAINTFNVTTLWLTTGLFQVIVEECPDALRPVKQLLAGGDVLGKEQVRATLENLPVILINGYGPTENTTFTTCHRIQSADVERSSIPIGRPINGTSVFILDKHLQPVPIGTAGELYIGGAGLTLGYLNHPELTNEKFIPHPFSEDPGARLYRSGDRCRYLPDGTIEFLGRMDRQVKVRGFRVELAEVERALARHPAVAQAKVITQGESAAEKHLAAYIVPKNGKTCTATELSRFLEQHLPPYMVPTTITVMESFPLTANGKIDHRRLPLDDRSAVAPRTTANTPLERQLIKIWQDVLGRKSIGIHDSFFDLGGHSLLGLRLFTRLQKEFGYRAPLATLFSSPTIASLADRIGRSSNATMDMSLVARIKPEGTRTPLICIHGGDGGILFYQDLARKLDSEQPLLAIESPALSDPDFDLTQFRIDSMTDTYIEIIQSAQPRGPYLLGGYSFGGLMAYDIACKLRAQGHEIERLILFDTANPAHEQAGRYTLGQRISANWQMNSDNSLLGRLSALTGRFGQGVVRKANHIHTIEKLERQYRLGLLDDGESRMMLLNEMHERAAMAYSPPPFDGEAILLRARTSNDRVALDDDFGWSKLVANLEVIEVPGSHLDLFDEPHLSELASALNKTLRSSETVLSSR